MHIVTEPKPVFILSSMRSGSTLMNYLISTRDEVSNLPETPIEHSKELIEKLTDEIVLIKCPGWFTNQSTYPQIPHFLNTKIIALIRNPYDTILSLHKMNLNVNLKNSLIMNERYLLNYWVNINRNIIALLSKYTDRVILVKYEDLVSNPIMVTNKIFNFIGVKDVRGVEIYEKPKKFEWGWGPSRGGDGGDIIKKLKVVPNRSRYSNVKLLTLIKNSREAQLIMDYFGYESSECYRF